MKTQSHYLRCRLAAVVCGVLGVGAAVLSSSAQVVLKDGNAEVSIDPNSQNGVSDWVVDGRDYLQKQWLWYRVGETAEASIDTLILSGITPIGTDQATLSYSGNGFDLSVTYSLLGGPLLSGVSDLAEQIEVINTSGGLLDFHLFLYSDFDLGGTAGDDVVTSVGWSPFPMSSPGYNSVKQEEDLDLQQTTFGTFADRAEAELVGVTLGHLNDGAPSSLLNSGVGFGPTPAGDMTYAFQWDLALGVGGSEIIGVDKRLDIVPIPEPAAAALFLLGLTALWRVSRRRDS